MRGLLLICFLFQHATEIDSQEAVRTSSEYFEQSFDAACKSEFSRAFGHFSNIYTTAEIYNSDVLSGQPVGIISYLGCDKISKRNDVFFLNYADHIPLQKVIVSRVIEIATLLDFENIVFIHNTPIEEAGCEKQIPDVSFNVWDDPHYNRVFREAKDNNLNVKIIENSHPIQAVDYTVSEVCEFYHHWNESKTIVISNSIFNLDTQQKSKFEEKLISGLKSVVSKKVIAMSQTDDLNNYDKSKWPSRHDLFVVDKSGGYYSPSKTYDAFLFNSYDSNRKEIARILGLKPYPIAINKNYGSTKFLEAYRLENSEDISFNQSSLEDKVGAKFKFTSMLMLEPSIDYLIRYIGKSNIVITERVVRVPVSDY